MFRQSPAQPPDMSAGLDSHQRTEWGPLPMSAPNDNRTGQGSRASGRKAYQKPLLSCYGNVTEVTQAVMGTMNLDTGGKGANNRTS
jgi:hypothetical protein